MINGAEWVPADPTLSQWVPVIGYPLICGAGKGQKMADPQGAGRVSQMVNGAGTRPAPTPTCSAKSIVCYSPLYQNQWSFFFYCHRCRRIQNLKLLY